MMDKEIWKEIEGYDGLYQVSNRGNIKSKWIFVSGKRNWRIGNQFKVMKLNNNEGGIAVLLTDKMGKKEKKSVAAIVLEIFDRKPNDDEVCIKIDGNPKNCNLENLKWGDRKDQSERSRVRGTMIVGEDHPFSILTNDDVFNIKKDIVFSDLNLKELGEKYGIRWGLVRKIMQKQCWKHIPFPEGDIKKIIEIECEECKHIFEEDRFKRGSKSRFCSNRCRRKLWIRNQHKKHSIRKKIVYREITNNEP